MPPCLVVNVPVKCQVSTLLLVMATVIPRGKVWVIATIVTTKEDKLTRIQTRKWFVIVKEMTIPKRSSYNNMEQSRDQTRGRKPSRRSSDEARVPSLQSTTPQRL